VATVSHKQLLDIPVDDFQKKLIRGGAFIDVKACFDQVSLEEFGIRVWRL
jgi:UDP-N-acetyl-D-galactosamine dehydrogenase